LLQRFHEGFRDRDKPLLRPVMLVKRLVEGEESLQVAVLRIDGRRGLSGNLGDQVHGGQVTQAVFGRLDVRHNVMG
jgi:hypothetical protein